MVLAELMSRVNGNWVMIGLSLVAIVIAISRSVRVEMKCRREEREAEEQADRDMTKFRRAFGPDAETHPLANRQIQREALDHEEERLPPLVPLASRVREKHGWPETPEELAAWVYYTCTGNAERARIHLERMLNQDEVVPRFILAAREEALRCGLTVEQVLQFDVARLERSSVGLEIVDEQTSP